MSSLFRISELPTWFKKKKKEIRGLNLGCAMMCLKKLISYWSIQDGIWDVRWCARGRGTTRIAGALYLIPMSRISAKSWSHGRSRALQLCICLPISIYFYIPFRSFGTKNPPKFYYSITSTTQALHIGINYIPRARKWILLNRPRQMK